MTLNQPPDDARVRVRFILEPDEDGHPPFGSETMWAVRTTTPGEVFLDSIPAFAEDVAVADRIQVVVNRGEIPTFTRLLQQGGHTTVCVVLEDNEEPEGVRAALRDMGCPSELYSDLGLIAVDVPPVVDYRKVRAFLEIGEKTERWEYAELALRHNY